MAIYKAKPGKRAASLRQTIFWAFWGALAGIYVFQPMFKAAHRDEKSILAAWLEQEEKDQLKSKSAVKSDTKMT